MSKRDKRSNRNKDINTLPATPLPNLQILCVILVQMCEGMNINVLFPFMAFMVEDMGYSGTQLGYHAGALAASFCGAQFCSSIPWGMVSDKYGRKPAIIFGTIGAAFGMLVFGSAKTYAQAVIGRLIGGLLNGNVGVLKSFLTEITDDTNRGTAFSYMSLAWSIGCILAPLVGGLLSKPADQYPSVFPHHSLFGEYPYLLPCIICAVFNTIAAIACYFCMIETRFTNCYSVDNEIVSVELSNVHKLNTQSTMKKTVISKLKKIVGKTNSSQDYAQLADSSVHNRNSANTILARIDSGGSDASTSPSVGNPMVKANVFTIMHSDDEEEEEGKEEDDHTVLNDCDVESAQTIDNLNDTSDKVIDFDSPGSEKTHNAKYTINPWDMDDKGFSDNSDEVNSACDSTNFDRDSDEEEEIPEYCFTSCLGNPYDNNKDSSKHGNTTTVLREKTVVLVTLNYGMLCMAQIVMDETIPLFLKADIEHGGLSFNSGQIGTLLSITGGMLLGFTYFLLPAFARYSKFWLFEVGCIAAIPVAMFWPFFAMLYRAILPDLQNNASRIVAMWPALLIINGIKACAAAFLFTAVMIQVNHSVPVAYLGAVNGLGQSFGALARSIGPAMGGVLWSIGTTYNFVFLNFIAVSLLFCICLYLNRILPRSLDFKRKENNYNKDSISPSNSEVIKGDNYDNSETLTEIEI